MGLLGAIFGFGKSVKRTTDWAGRKKTVVTYHDSGKRRTYTHGCGVFGNVTKTKTEKHGRTVEEGRLKQNFLWGATEQARRTDGTSVERNYTPGFFRNHVTTHIKGQCFKCDGVGSKTLNCKICNGTGSHTGTCRFCAGRGKIHVDAKPCFTCQGRGYIQSFKCNRCKGTGEHKPAEDLTCQPCKGVGRFSAPCNKCKAKGNFSVTCDKCHGSGRYEKTERK